jgi:hypothetical protein
MKAKVGDLFWHVGSLGTLQTMNKRLFCRYIGSEKIGKTEYPTMEILIDFDPEDGSNMNGEDLFDYVWDGYTPLTKYDEFHNSNFQKLIIQRIFWHKK